MAISPAYKVEHLIIELGNRSKKLRYFSMIYLVLFLSNFSYSSDINALPETIRIKVVTEDTFPLQYLENGKVSGPATALVEAVLSAAGISYHIEILPWARAYHSALTEPNVLIYSIAKTITRADKFKWTGRIIALDYYLYGEIDSDINFQTPLETLKRYKIGVVRDSAVYQYLQGNGFKNLTTVVQGKQNFLLFEQDRVDLIPANNPSFHAICRQGGFNCNTLKPVYKLDISAIDLYMAFSLQTDDAIVEKVRSAYNQMKAQKNS